VAPLPQTAWPSSETPVRPERPRFLLRGSSYVGQSKQPGLSPVGTTARDATAALQGTVRLGLTDWAARPRRRRHRRRPKARGLTVAEGKECVGRRDGPRAGQGRQPTETFAHPRRACDVAPNVVVCEGAARHLMSCRGFQGRCLLHRECLAFRASLRYLVYTWGPRYVLARGQEERQARRTSQAACLPFR